MVYASGREGWAIRDIDGPRDQGLIGFGDRRGRFDFKFRIAVKAMLEMEDRGFTTELTVFATNPKD